MVRKPYEDSSGAGRPRTQAELLTEQFYAWERCGRGWKVWENPVVLEPPFAPFKFHWVGPTGQYDDGRRPTVLSSLTDGLLGALGSRSGRRPDDDLPVLDVEEVDPDSDEDESEIRELRISMPPESDVSPEVAEHLLLSLPRSERPVAFEVIGTPESISIQVACAVADSELLRQHTKAIFPKAIVVEVPGALEQAFSAVGSGQTAVVEFGLSEEFMLPLKVSGGFRVDPLTAVAAALSNLDEGEAGALQVLFQPVRKPWAESILRAVLDERGSPFFLDAPEITSLARNKVSRPLFACIVRVAGRSPEPGRATLIARSVGWALNALTNPPGNRLIPLTNSGYPDDAHEADFLGRRTRRSGMILSSAEVVSLVHPPSASVRVEKLIREAKKTRAAPGIASDPGYVLGTNAHAGKSANVGLSPDQRSRHLYIIGASGTGKSTLLLNLILQDLEAGAGLALLDPHGDLVDEVLRRCPQKRAGDVVLIDPADTEYPIGFNILSAHSELERTLLSSDLVAVFRRLSTSWGDQMTSVLGNAILAFLESERGGTLVDLRRFLIEPAYRKEYLKTVRDPEVVYYWEKEFSLLRQTPQAPILTRLDTFLRPKTIRYMVAQRDSRLDLRRLMDEGGVLLARLSQGAIGEENAYLLGTLLVSRLQQMAMSRQELEVAERRPFYVYLDEFQNFVTPTMEAILSGARKYGLGLVLAHHDLHQIQSRSPEVLNSVLTHPYARVCFRVGDQDARKLAEGLSHFDAKDLQSLGTGEAIARVERAEYDFNLATTPLPRLDPSAGQGVREAIVARSREQFGRPRSEVEELLRGPVAERSAPTAPVEPPTVTEVRRTVPPPTHLAAQMDRVELPTRVETTSRGRGGSQHKYLQELIRRWAEAHGWRADIEERILDGLGSVDVALRKGERAVACEIGISTSPEHELQNVQKCLAAGFDQVVVVSSEKRSLNQIKALAAAALPEEQAGKVAYCTPEELFDFLDGVEATSRSTERTVRGYRVKVRFGEAKPEEREQRQGAVSAVIAKAIKGMKRRKG